MALAAAALLMATAAPAGAGANWTTYHGDPARTGNDTTAPTLTPISRAWGTTLDGAVYGQTVVTAGRVIAVTEEDSVYALDAHDGHVLWHYNAGTPLTDVVNQTGCGNIDPLGITSTPVIDTGRSEVFVVAEIKDGNQLVHHQLIGLGLYSGAVETSANADPPSAQQDPIHIQQRSGLALGNGRVYIGFGGLAGDCGAYHGWLVSLDENGNNKVSFDTTPNGSEGAIWGTSGPAIDGQGNVYVSTGNGDGVHLDYQESDVKLSPTLTVLDHFTPSNWASLDASDADIASVGPSLLNGGLLFQIGKQRDGFIVNTSNMSSGVRTVSGVCSSDADGGNAYNSATGILYVPCNEGIRAVDVNAGANLWEQTTPVSAGPPVIAGGLVWTVAWTGGTLYGLDPTHGNIVAQISVGSSVPHFASPTSALGLLIVGTDSGVVAFDGPSGVPPSTCTAQANHNGYWMAAADGGIFSFAGAPFCGSTGGQPLVQPVVGMAGTSGPGYWTVARDGGVFAFNVAFLGSMGGHPLVRPIVGMTSTPSSGGYWLVASDGGIFSFGDATYLGSMGGHPLTRPIVGMESSPGGYRLVASDGGLFSFGVPFGGSLGGVALVQPIVAIAHD